MHFHEIVNDENNEIIVIPNNPELCFALMHRK